SGDRSVSLVATPLAPPDDELPLSLPPRSPAPPCPAPPPPAVVRVTPGDPALVPQPLPGLPGPSSPPSALASMMPAMFASPSTANATGFEPVRVMVPDRLSDFSATTRSTGAPFGW